MCYRTHSEHNAICPFLNVLQGHNRLTFGCDPTQLSNSCCTCRLQPPEELTEGPCRLFSVVTEEHSRPCLKRVRRVLNKSCIM